MKKTFELLVVKSTNKNNKDQVSASFYWVSKHKSKPYHFGLRDSIDKEKELIEICKRTIAVLEKWGMSILTKREIDWKKLLKHKEYPTIKEEKKFYKNILDDVEIVIKRKDNRIKV